MSGETEITLDNLAGGAANEIFVAAMAQVVENLMDPNTDAVMAREITLKVIVKPIAGNRGQAHAKIRVQTKLAPANDVGTTMFFGKVGSRFVAAGVDRGNGPLFKEPGPESGVVANISQERKA